MDIEQLIKEQEERERLKHNFMKRLDYLIKKAVSRGIKRKALKAELEEKESIREKLIVILRKIMELEQTVNSDIESEINRIEEEKGKDIARLFELVERTCAGVNQKDIKKDEKSKSFETKLNILMAAIHKGISIASNNKGKRYLRNKAFCLSIGFVLTLSLIVIANYSGAKNTSTSSTHRLESESITHSSAKRFTIQVGAFRSGRRADILKKRLVDPGYRYLPYIIKTRVKNTDWWNVRIGVFENYQEAKVFSKKLISRGAIRDYYVLNEINAKIHSRLKGV